MLFRKYQPISGRDPPLVVTNLYADVEDIPARFAKLGNYFGRIGFKPVTDKVLALAAYRKPTAKEVMASLRECVGIAVPTTKFQEVNGSHD